MKQRKGHQLAKVSQTDTQGKEARVREEKQRNKETHRHTQAKEEKANSDKEKEREPMRCTSSLLTFAPVECSSS